MCIRDRVYYKEKNIDYKRKTKQFSAYVYWTFSFSLMSTTISHSLGPPFGNILNRMDRMFWIDKTGYIKVQYIQKKETSRLAQVRLHSMSIL